MRVLIDGSALSRSVFDEPEAAAWRSWFADHRADAVTSEVAAVLVRRQAQLAGDRPWMLARELLAAIPQVRISDQALVFAAKAAHALDSFEALQVGLAYTDPDITAVATYDPTVAAAAALFRVPVISPGREPLWWTAPDVISAVRMHDVEPLVGEPPRVAQTPASAHPTDVSRAPDPAPEPVPACVQDGGPPGRRAEQRAWERAVAQSSPAGRPIAMAGSATSGPVPTVRAGSHRHAGQVAANYVAEGGDDTRERPALPIAQHSVPPRVPLPSVDSRPPMVAPPAVGPPPVIAAPGASAVPQPSVPPTVAPIPRSRPVPPRPSDSRPAHVSWAPVASVRSGGSNVDVPSPAVQSAAPIMTDREPAGALLGRGTAKQGQSSGGRRQARAQSDTAQSDVARAAGAAYGSSAAQRGEHVSAQARRWPGPPAGLRRH